MTPDLARRLAAAYRELAELWDEAAGRAGAEPLEERPRRRQRTPPALVVPPVVPPHDLARAEARNQLVHLGTFTARRHRK